MKAKTVRRSGTRLEEQAALMLRGMGFPPFQREYVYGVPGRKFRADFAWVDKKVAMEVIGGVFMKNRNARGHASGTGITNDCRRRAEIHLCGWLVIEATPEMLGDLSAAALVARAIKARTA